MTFLVFATLALTSYIMGRLLQRWLVRHTAFRVLMAQRQNQNVSASFTLLLLGGHRNPTVDTQMIHPFCSTTLGVLLAQVAAECTTATTTARRTKGADQTGGGPKSPSSRPPLTLLRCPWHHQPHQGKALYLYMADYNCVSESYLLVLIS